MSARCPPAVPAPRTSTPPEPSRPPRTPIVSCANPDPRGRIGYLRLIGDQVENIARRVATETLTTHG